MEHRVERGIETGEISGILSKRFTISVLRSRETKLLLYRRPWKILNGKVTYPAFQKIPAAPK